MSELRRALLAGTGLRHRQDGGEQRGAGRAAELHGGLEHGVAVRGERRRHLAQRAGHDIRELQRIAQSEDEVQPRQQRRSQVHRTHEQQHRGERRHRERGQNRSGRTEFVIEHAADRSAERADQRTRQHQRAGHERVGAQRQLRQIGDHIAEADADHRQDRIRQQMQQHNAITQESESDQRRERTTRRPAEEQQRSDTRHQAHHGDQRGHRHLAAADGRADRHAGLVEEHDQTAQRQHDRHELQRVEHGILGRVLLLDALQANRQRDQQDDRDHDHEDRPPRQHAGHRAADGRADGRRHGDHQRAHAHQPPHLGARRLFQDDVHHQRRGHARADALDHARGEDQRERLRHDHDQRAQHGQHHGGHEDRLVPEPSFDE